MSALLPRADVCAATPDVGYGPEADMSGHAELFECDAAFTLSTASNRNAAKASSMPHGRLGYKK